MPRLPAIASHRFLRNCIEKCQAVSEKMIRNSLTEENGIASRHFMRFFPLFQQIQRLKARLVLAGLTITSSEFLKSNSQTVNLRNLKFVQLQSDKSGWTRFRRDGFSGRDLDVLLPHPSEPHLLGQALSQPNLTMQSKFVSHI
jgi:hypothetical protein